MSRILPTLAIMLSVGSFFLYINPTWTGSIAETKLSISSNEKALEAAQGYQKQEEKLTQERNNIDPGNLDRLKLLLPDSVDNVSLILNLNALASKSQLSLSNIDVAKSVPSTSGPGQEEQMVGGANSKVDSVDMTLSAIGTYSAMKAFLDGLEKSQRLLDVKDISIRGSDTGVYTYQMRLRIYWLR